MHWPITLAGHGKPKDQGASSNQTHNINHVHVDEEVVETALAILSLQSTKAQLKK